MKNPEEDIPNSGDQQGKDNLHQNYQKYQLTERNQTELDEEAHILQSQPNQEGDIFKASSLRRQSKGKVRLKEVILSRNADEQENSLINLNNLQSKLRIRRNIQFIQPIAKDLKSNDYRPTQSLAKDMQNLGEFKKKMQKKQKNLGVGKFFKTIELVNKGFSKAAMLLQSLNLFLYKIKVRVQKKDFLTKYHYQVMEDLSTGNYSQQLKSMKVRRNYVDILSEQKLRLNKYIKCLHPQIIYNQFINMLYYLPSVNPDGYFNIIWQAVVTFNIIFVIFLYPIDFIMGRNNMAILYPVQWNLGCLVSFIVFCTTIVLNFNTGINYKGFVEYDKRQIANQYMKGLCIYDLCSLIPYLFGICQINASFKLWNLLVFMKLVNINITIEYICEKMINKKNWLRLIFLIKLIFTIALIGHILGLIFWGVANVEPDDTMTWLKVKNYDQYTWSNKYIYSLYFAITTMTTIGYGDISPQTPAETAVWTCCMVAASITFAYTVNSIGAIIDDIRKEDKEYKTEIAKVNLYCQKRRINQELQQDVQKYLKYKHQAEKILSHEEENQIFSKLPENIQERIKSEQNSYIIKQAQKLFGHFSQKVQNLLVNYFQDHYLQKNEVLFQEGECEENPCFYYLLSGQVEIFVKSHKQSQQKKLQTLNEGSIFGEYSFYSLQPRTASAKVVRPSVIVTLSHKDFIDVIKHYPQDYETYLMKRDKIIYNQSTVQLNTLCYSCKKMGHYINKCPLIHYYPDKERLILKENQDNIYKQDRDPQFLRYQRVSICALSDRIIILDTLDKLSNFYPNQICITYQDYYDSKKYNLEENFSGVQQATLAQPGQQNQPQQGPRGNHPASNKNSFIEKEPSYLQPYAQQWQQPSTQQPVFGRQLQPQNFSPSQPQQGYQEVQQQSKRPVEKLDPFKETARFGGFKVNLLEFNDGSQTDLSVVEEKQGFSQPQARLDRAQEMYQNSQAPQLQQGQADANQLLLLPPNANPNNLLLTENANIGINPLLKPNQNFNRQISKLQNQARLDAEPNSSGPQSYAPQQIDQMMGKKASEQALARGQKKEDDVIRKHGGQADPDKQGQIPSVQPLERIDEDNQALESFNPVSFEFYYPWYNFNAQKLLDQFNMFCLVPRKHPGFGKYTLFSRKIKNPLKNYALNYCRNSDLNEQTDKLELKPAKK